MDQLGNVEGIKADFGVRKLLPCPGLKSLGHVHRDEADGLRAPLMFDEIRLEGRERIRFSSFDGADHAAGHRVVEEGQIAESPTHVLLIDTQRRDLHVGRGLSGRLHMGIDRSPDAVFGDTKHLGDSGDGQLLGERQNQCIHQQGEATAGTGPWHRDLGDLAAMPALHPRQGGMQKGFELEEMQVLPSALNPIMNQLIGLGTGRTFQTLDRACEIKVNLAQIGLKANLRNLPRFLQTQSSGEKGGGIHAKNDLSTDSKGTSG